MLVVIVMMNLLTKVMLARTRRCYVVDSCEVGAHDCTEDDDRDDA